MAIKVVLRRLLRAATYVATGRAPQRVTAQINVTEAHNSLQGKRILVTGGSRGLGFAMAKRFVEAGAGVIIAGRDSERLQQAASEIGARWMQLDVTDTNACSAAIAMAEQLVGGPLDCLVNNAGVSLHEAGFEAVTPNDFNRQINTNLRGPYFLTQAFVKGRKRGSSVLFVSSERGQQVDYLPYGMTKAAINSLTQALAFRYASQGIRVNAIAPGVTASDMTGFSSTGDIAAGFYPAGRVYLPEEVAQVAEFILGPAAECLSGQIIYCNNGQTVNSTLRHI